MPDNDERPGIIGDADRRSIVSESVDLARSTDGAAARGAHRRRGPWYRRPAAVMRAAGWCLVALVLLWLAYRSVAVADELGNANAEASANSQGLAQANVILRSLGHAPVPTPTTSLLKGPPGPAGPTGSTGPTPSPEAVKTALTAYCATNLCGTPPTPAQVAQAVSNYCTSRGDCRGPRGTAGQSGAAGQTGAAGRDGADGTSPSAAQVGAAVSAYCAQRSGCAGQPGKDGAQGSTGPVGPSGAAGPPGPSGADGSPGPSGAAGPSGAVGPPGTAGQPPVSWTYTDALGAAHTCSRADGFDPSAPTYTCT